MSFALLLLSHFKVGLFFGDVRGSGTATVPPARGVFGSPSTTPISQPSITETCHQGGGERDVPLLFIAKRSQGSNIGTYINLMVD